MISQFQLRWCTSSGTISSTISNRLGYFCCDL